MGIEKKCLCGKTIVDRSGKISIAAICDECRFDETLLPAEVLKREPKCGNCGGAINFIGAFVARALPSPHPIGLYYDCPNPGCSRRRMSFLFLQLRVRRSWEN